MPRKLPWLHDGAKQATSARAQRPAKRQRRQTLDLDDDQDSAGAGTPRRKGKGRANRTPSSSPPPQPPENQYMMEGLAADDIWIMVEDEFLDTARLFTQHLHHAEYHRLKRLAREKNAFALQSVNRPVVPWSQMSIEAKKKNEARAKADSQTQALLSMGAEEKEAGPAAEGSEEEDAPWMRDPHLGGLMSGRKDFSATLANLAGAKPNTRAAAGYAVSKPSSKRRVDDARNSTSNRARPSTMIGLAQEIERVGGSDDDDLDGLSLKNPVSRAMRPPSAPTTRPVKAGEPSTRPKQPPKPPDLGHSSSMRPPDRHRNPSNKTCSTLTSASVKASSVSRSESVPAPRSSVTSASTITFSKPARSTSVSRFGFSDDLPKQQDSQNDWEKRMAKRKAKKETEEKKKSISADEIPTFLI